MRLRSSVLTQANHDGAGARARDALTESPKSCDSRRAVPSPGVLRDDRSTNWADGKFPAEAFVAARRHHARNPAEIRTRSRPVSTAKWRQKSRVGSSAVE